jgi:hypothetical protein
MAKPDLRSTLPSATSDPRGHTTTTGVIMKSLGRTLKVVALAIGVLTMSACSSLEAGHAGMVPAAKVDSGLGEMPHYRDWVDPSGRTPMQAMVATHDKTR